MPVQREYLSPNEIAEVLGVSAFTIRRYIKLGELRAVKLLGGFRVHRDDLQRFLKAHEVNPAEEELLPEETTANKPDAEKAAPPGPLPAPAERTPPPAIPPPAPTPELTPRRATTPPPVTAKKVRGASAKKSRRSEKI